MRKFLQNLPVLAVFIATTLLFFYPIFKGYIPFPGDLLTGGREPYKSQINLGFPPGGVPNKAQGPDVIHELYPWKYFVIDSFKKGEIPFWTPYNFSGNPIMANFQSGTFYLLNFVFFVMPFLNAWTVFITLAAFLASVFTYLFLRLLKLSILSSIFGGIVFAFSSYMIVWMEYGNITHTLMFFPLVLYFTEKYIQDSKWQNILFLTVSLWLSFLAGYIQGFFYIFVVTSIYFISKVSILDKKNYKKIIVFSIALVFPILLSLFQLLPTLSLFQMSSRGSYSLEQIIFLLNPWWYSITALVPDFFGNPATRNFWFAGTYIERVSYFGVIPLLLSLTVIFSTKTKEQKIFIALFIFSFLLSVDIFITRYFYQLPIPVLSTTVPTRILSIFVFCGAILSAFGLENLLKNKNRKQFILTGFGALTFLFILWAYVFVFSADNQNLLIAKRNLILPTLFVFVFIVVILLRFTNFIKQIPYASGALPLVLLVCTVFELFYFFHKITPFSPREFVYPKTSVISYLQETGGIDRFWGYGSGYISSNFQTVDKTFSPEGNDPLHIVSYTEVLEASKDGKLPKALPRPDANIAPGFGTGDLNSNQYRQKILNILGVKYILHKNDTLPDGKEYQPDIATFDNKKYKLIWQEKPWQIYENLSVVPRFFLTNKYQVISGKEEVISTIYSSSFREKEEIVLSSDPQIKKEDLNKKVASLISYSQNKVTIKTSTDADSLLFLSDTYSPNWKAEVDGKPTEVLIANHAFRAVVVPSGDHVITYFYKDADFEKGLIMSSFSAILFIVFLIYLKKKKI